MNIDDAIAGRRSVREYTAQNVEKAAITRLIQTAILAPSAVNQQPWVFSVVAERELLDRISGGAKRHMLETIKGNPHEAHFRAHLDDPDFHVFYHAPALIVIAAGAAGPWITEDCALAAENLMLAAHARGLGTCWIGFAQSYLNTAEGKQALGLPAEAVPVAPIIVGHPKLPPPPVPRNPPNIIWIG